MSSTSITKSGKARNRLENQAFRSAGTFSVAIP